MKIIFAGTPLFAVNSLESLYNKGYDIPLVISQGDKKRGRGKKLQYTPVKEKALELGLEVFQPENINSQESIEKIRGLNPDFIVVVAFGQILKKELLDIPKYSCINVHASLLPKYRGAAPINWSIIKGEKETGITIMEMAEGLDSGDMILKETIKIRQEDDYPILHDKLSRLGSELLIEALEMIVKEEAVFEPQNHDLSTYAPMLYKDTGKIDWNKNTIDIINLIKGVNPWPGAYTFYGEDMLKIHKASIINEDIQGQAGEIVKVDKSGIFVKTKDGILLIEELQFPNKKRMKVRDYIVGNSIEEKIILK